MDRTTSNKKLERCSVKLDITAKMYDDAVKKYNNISEAINASGLPVEIYPQGSFRLGTVVRPYREGKEQSFDLDFICKVQYEKYAIEPKALKAAVRRAIDKTKYSDNLIREQDRCWTLNFKKGGQEIGFMMDVVPAVNEEQHIINDITEAGIEYRYASDAVAITHKEGTVYRWVQSNPHGYAAWFDDVNKPFVEYKPEERKRLLMESYDYVGAAIEDVPDVLVRTTLQRVIQVLKRHRDMYYSHSPAFWRERPTSAIITTLCAQIARRMNPGLSFIDLLSEISEELLAYIPLLSENEMFFTKFNRKQAAYSFINKKDTDKWEVRNPVNPYDNYCDSWSENTAQLFFKWLESVYDDFVDVENVETPQYESRIQKSLGYNLNASEPKKTPSIIIPEKKIETPTQPWSNIR